MSSTPHSPPETPLKPAIAVDNGNLAPNARSFEAPSKAGVQEPASETASKNSQQPNARSFEIPSRSGIQEPAAETPSKKFQQSKPRSEVQCPSTLPHDEPEDGSANKPVPEIEQIHPDASVDPTEEAEDDHQVETETLPVSNPDQPLPPMDWEEFEGRYRDAMQTANDEEDALLVEFDKYVEAFSVWAIAPAQRDNERGWKRLKTRQRYVQLAEGKLKEKQDHYTEVVRAFQMALELLRR